MSQTITLKGMPDPLARGPHWIKEDDKVLCVYRKHGDIQVLSGSISSSPSSHSGIDNAKETVVWFDEPLNRNADNADDAHERTFKVNDPLLFRRDEAIMLQDRAFAGRWFQGLLSPAEIDQVVAKLPAPDLEQDMAQAAGRDKGSPSRNPTVEEWAKLLAGDLNGN